MVLVCCLKSEGEDTQLDILVGSCFVIRMVLCNGGQRGLFGNCLRKSVLAEHQVVRDVNMSLQKITERAV